MKAVLQHNLRRGFTLVELLVVIAIIALLIALVFPLIRVSLQKSKLPRCLNNMRSISIAGTQHASNNDGMQPGSNWGTRGQAFGWAAGWLYDWNTYGTPTLDTLEVVKSGQLWPYLRSFEAYRCPADIVPDPSSANKDAIPNRPNNARMITSYCMNGTVGHWSNRYDAPTKSWNTFRISQFKPNDILYWEPDEFNRTTFSAGDWWDASNSPDQHITRRHLDRVVVGCNDGHAEVMLSKDFEWDAYVTQKGHFHGNPPAPSRLWNVPGSVSGK